MPLKYFASTDAYVELKDTTRLQKESLDNFASRLKYYWDNIKGNYHLCGNLLSDDRYSMNRVSLNTMQNWHNGSFAEHGLYSWHGERIIDVAAEKIGVNTTQLELAVSNKVLHTTHLQWSKKRKELACTDHQISFI